MTLPNHVEMLDKLYGKALDREAQKAADRRAIMTRLPPDMLTDLTALKAAFGPLAIRWVHVGGETMHGREPDRAARVEPVALHRMHGGGE